MWLGDTLFPDGPGSGGSVVTGSITPPTRTAAYTVKQKLFSLVAGNWGAEANMLVAEDGQIVHKEDAFKKISMKDALSGMRTGQISATESRIDDYGGFRQSWGLS